MKKNLYFRHMIARVNKALEFIYDVFLSISSYPRMVIEVFIRKNFGVRYFKLSTALTIAVILSLLPRVGEFMYGDFFGGDIDAVSWYVFILLFLGYSVKHWLDKMNTPGVFDFSRMTKYAGDIHPMFSKINVWGWRADVRMVETIFEPALFYMIGAVLYLVGFNLGTLLMIVSIIYSMSYFAAYKKGDDFVMNIIDEQIFNEEMEAAFVMGKPAEECRGVRFHTRKPKLLSSRLKLADAMIEDTSKVEFTLAE